MRKIGEMGHNGEGICDIMKKSVFMKEIIMANLSQQKREKLLAFIASLREQHKDDASLKALNELENALYGLV